MKRYQQSASKRCLRGEGMGELAPRLGSKRGTTFIELMVVMAISAVVASMFSRMVLTSSGVRQVGRENGMAADAAQGLLEKIRNQPYRDIFALYNNDPSDDPGGAGTAPGNRFPVQGLKVAAGVQDGCHLEVILPQLAPGTPCQLTGTKWNYDDKSGLEPELTWELREDYNIEDLGFPRDLNGDSMIDAENHAADYIILPIMIRVEWEGRQGLRRYEISTMLVDFIKI